jgi:hypothetical protein
MTDKPDEAHDPTDMSHPRYDSAKDPLSPFYEGDKAESEATSGSPDGNPYKVGPGFPPNEHKWKKGCPSPYPKGRPKKVPSLEPEVKKLFEDALNVKVHVTKADKKIMMTRLAMGFEQLAIQWAKGDRHARRDLMDYAVRLGSDLLAGQKAAIEEALGIDQQAIVEAFLRRKQQLPAEPSPEDHVKAPPDLLDDDVTKPDPNENPVNSPQPDTRKKSSEPFLDEHGKPLSVSDPRYIQALRERNLAQVKKDQEES